MDKSKRKPPSFRHLPQERAKKLKKEWVIKQKIKSKWKSQKRREGILPQPDTSTQTLQPPSLREERSVSEDDTGIDEMGDEVKQGSDDEPMPSASVQQIKQMPHEQKKHAPCTGSSLRELQKQAYSPASLHHYKSRPLRHPKSRMASNEVSFQKREASIGAAKHGQGGGQPNMRLRMTAMLEKIKRDCS
ncbi:hypothetical protein EDB83DRAFT_1258824 [Lactarius deliciosus]|nr:hypothetical protein EDB83DRAFT_1258824 [Lactarius deliciosus]